MKEAGLPEVAEIQYKKKPILWVMLSAILIIGVSVFLHEKPKQKSIEPVEEAYTLETNNPVEEVKNNPQPIVQVTPAEQQQHIVTQEEIALIHAKQAELQQRLAAPLMIVNNAQTNNTVTTTQSTQPNVASNDRNTQFMNQVANQEVATATATHLGSLNSIIAEGSLIHAILEPATNSDLPGYVRAIVSESSYSEDGTAILIPKGSRLIGQYKSGMLQGQSRIFMVWTRVITPDGVSVQLGSPGVDSLGSAGMNVDEINRHFWERFSNASLLSIIGAGAANLGVTGADESNSAATYRSALASSFAQSAEQSLQQNTRIPPTLMTYQGKSIMVFVARDLRFTAMQLQPHLSVF